MTTTPFLFTFAAKGLQSYIMRGGKLRDMVGATSLVDKLSDPERLTELLKDTFGIDPQNFKILQAAAGGARIKFDREADAHCVNQAWPLWCRAWAPDLEMVQDVRPMDGSFAAVSHAASEALERARNFVFARLPEAGPWMQRAPRTGEPAVEKDHAADAELIDEATRRKRAEREELRFAKTLPLAITAFGFNAIEEIPRDFEKVSGDERAYLAVIHADGNKLGQMFINVVQALKKEPLTSDLAAIDLLRYLSSEVVAEGTREAVRKTMTKLRAYVVDQQDSENTQRARDGQPFKAEDPWPFAPIVLAGDDVTLVCRADLGISFAEEFLITFKAEMTKRLRKIQGEGFWSQLPEHVKEAVPSGLSAGAGIVFCNSRYPFSLAYELCESLAKQAKDEAKKKAGDVPPSALSFVRITGSSAPTNFHDLVKGGILQGADDTMLTGCPYFVDIDDSYQPRLSRLRAAAEAACPSTETADSGNEEPRGLPRSSLRGLLHLQQTDPLSVPAAVTRMVDVAGSRAEAFKEAWVQLTEHDCKGTEWNNLRFSSLINDKRSPLLDMLTIHAVNCAPSLTPAP
ncbi:MAG: hypothetical protein WCK17_00400 [Verrucomicrobiota bacterium]